MFIWAQTFIMSPAFIRMYEYGTHIQDNDHRVREATHKAMAAFLVKVRKDFQPHLKMVMGAWTAGMNDSHNSASAAAITAFTETFSADRQQQVFQFTFKEIVQVLCYTQYSIVIEEV